MSKLFCYGALCASLLCAGLSQAQNLITNGDFATDLSGWSIASGGVAQTTIAHDGADGVPAGSALLDRVDSTESDNKDILYQIIPVTNGVQYQLDAEWKGDLYVDGIDDGLGRNWAEAMVTFLPSDAAMADGSLFLDGWIQYKRASGNNGGGPNNPPVNGFGWESILDAPDAGPADGIFTATDDYMLVGFNLGGRANSNDGANPGYYWVDNVSVTRVVPEPTSLALVVLGFGAVALRRRAA